MHEFPVTVVAESKPPGFGRPPMTGMLPAASGSPSQNEKDITRSSIAPPFELICLEPSAGSRPPAR
jgi:hypothetical protein